MIGISGERPRPLLLTRVGPHLCAVPIEHVIETMRPLPIEGLANAPSFVLGVAIVRGCPVPVVDTGALLGTPRASSSRFVALRLGERTCVLDVDGVLGVRDLRGAPLSELPPLLRHKESDAVESIGALDTRLLVVLRSSRIVPDHVWAAMTEARQA